MSDKQVWILAGGNGAGKTTLFNIISGFMTADSGDIVYQKDRGTLSLIDMPSYKRTRVGIGRMFQDTHIFPGMTVLENMLLADENTFGELAFVSIFRPKKNKAIEAQRIKKVKKIFKALFGEPNPFWHKKDELAGSLSFGQQRLLGLARLFMANYNLVLLDEPTAGVNPQIIQQVLAIIRSMVEEMGATVFLIEHNMKVVLDIADFCSFMSHGKITAFGTPEDVIGNDEVRKTYLGI